MKKIFLQSILLFFAATTLSAQTILKGDMNDDNEVTIADVTSVVNVVLGKAPLETISAGCSCEPYKVDNTSVVGTWYAADGTSFQFNEDGTTTFPGGATYEFMPMQGRLLVYDAMKHPIKVLPLIKVESEYLLSVDYATSVFTYYTNSQSLVTGLTMSESSLVMNSGTTHQLTITATPEDAFNTYVTWSSSDENIATVDQNGLVTALIGGTVTITATATDGSGQSTSCIISITQMVTGITLSETTLALVLDGYKKLSATILPNNAANKNVTWSSSNENIAQVMSNGGVVGVGRGTCTITATANDGSGVTANCEVTIYRDESGTIDGRNFVDLDLPSGTLWATCNVGASSPEEYGDYFAWGETTGHNDGKDNFAWSTYKWCKGSSSTLTKYCCQSSFGYEGFTDGKMELDLEDDAAYVNWGAVWRMPSAEQYDELINSSYTTTEWTTQNGVNGYKITSLTNGNSIFLSAASSLSYNNTSPSGGLDGRYRSRTLGWPQVDSGHAWNMSFTSSSIKRLYDGYTRCFGMSVRPVRNTTE